MNAYELTDLHPRTNQNYLIYLHFDLFPPPASTDLPLPEMYFIFYNFITFSHIYDICIYLKIIYCLVCS